MVMGDTAFSYAAVAPVGVLYTSGAPLAYLLLPQVRSASQCPGLPKPGQPVTLSFGCTSITSAVVLFSC